MIKTVETMKSVKKVGKIPYFQHALLATESLLKVCLIEEDDVMKILLVIRSSNKPTQELDSFTIP